MAYNSYSCWLCGGYIELYSYMGERKLTHKTGDALLQKKQTGFSSNLVGGNSIKPPTSNSIKIILFCQEVNRVNKTCPGHDESLLESMPYAFLGHILNHSHLGCVWTFLLVLSGRWVLCEISWKRFPLSSVLWLKNSTDLTEEQLSEVYHRFVSEIKTSREGRIAFWKQCCFIQYMNPPNREPHPCVHISNYLKIVNSKSFLWGYFVLASFFSKKLTPRSTKPSGHDALWVFSHGCWAKKFKYRVKRDLGFSMWKQTFFKTPTAINKHDLVHIVLLTIFGGHSNSFN